MGLFLAAFMFMLSAQTPAIRHAADWGRTQRSIYAAIDFCRSRKWIGHTQWWNASAFKYEPVSCPNLKTRMLDEPPHKGWEHIFKQESIPDWSIAEEKRTLKIAQDVCKKNGYSGTSLPVWDAFESAYEKFKCSAWKR